MGWGWATFGNWRWSFQPGSRQTVFMVSASLVVAVLIEWFAVFGLHRWNCTEHMPRIPVLDVGVTPILQMLILTPLLFTLTHKFFPEHHKKRDGPS